MSPASLRAACSRNSATRSASISASMASYWYIGASLVPSDQIDPALGSGRAGGVQQDLDRLAALGLLAVVVAVGRPKGPQPFAVADGRDAAFHRGDVDQIGLDQESDLAFR